MSAKPIQLPQWATDETNNTEPSLGQKETGWVPFQDGVSDYDNWYKQLVYRWCEYIDDGELEGDIVLDGTLWINPAVPRAFPHLRVVGNAFVDGDLETTGDIEADEVLAADYNHTVERRATMPVTLNASTGMGMIADIPHQATSSAGTFWYYSPPVSAVGMREGDVLTKVRVRFSGNSSLSSFNVDVVHFRHDLGTANTTGSSNAAGGYVEVVPAVNKNTLAVHDTMLDIIWIRVSGSQSGIAIEGIDVFWTHPA